MKKTLAAALAAGLVSLLALAGCGPSQDGKPTPVPAGTGKPLTLWVYDQGRIEVLTAIGKQFEAQYGIPVEVSMVDLGQIRNQMLLASGGGECADMAIIPHDNLGGLVENAAVAEVELGSARDKLLGPAVEGFTYNGKIYGVPLSVENIGFFRNTEMVPEAPATWDDMIAVGKKLVAAGKAEVIMGLPDATYNSFPVYSSFGGSIFGRNDDGSLSPEKVTIADAGFVKGLELLTGLVKEGLVPKTIDWDAAHVLFESGKAPFCMTGPWALNRFKTAGIPYAISAFPAAKAGGEGGQPFLGVQGIVISASSPQALLAKTFATDFIATEENMKAIYTAEPRPSAWKTIFESASDADSAGFNAAGAKAIPMPSIPAMGYVWDSWVSSAALAFSGEKSPADALAQARNQIDTQVKNSK